MVFQFLVLVHSPVCVRCCGPHKTKGCFDQFVMESDSAVRSLRLLLLVAKGLQKLLQRGGEAGAPSDVLSVLFSLDLCIDF